MAKLEASTHGGSSCCGRCWSCLVEMVSMWPASEEQSCHYEGSSLWQPSWSMSREEVSTGLPVGRSLEPFGRTHRGALGSGRRRRRFDIGMVSRIGEWILHREPTVVVLAVSMQELFRGQRGFEYIYINKLRGRDHERSNVGRDTPLSFAVQEIVAPRQTRCHQENLLEKQKDRNDEASTTSLQC
jgi:hypothetical protein